MWLTTPFPSSHINCGHKAKVTATGAPRGRRLLLLAVRTFSSSGSQESSVSERTLDRWTPRLLQHKPLCLGPSQHALLRFLRLFGPFLRFRPFV